MPFRIYIETTIPSFYYEGRPEPEHVSRRAWTRRWWDNYRHLDQIFSSSVVLDELQTGDYPLKAEKLAFLEKVQLLPHAREIDEIANIYMERFLMPLKASNDAFHMAFASFHRCNILLTWNCAHLANAKKRSHLAAVNTELALPVPDVLTPLNLLGGNDAI